MIKEIRYTSIKRVLDNIMDHPMLRDVSMEQAIRYALRFINLFGAPKLFCERIADVPIHEFRGVLPCDLVSIEQVRDKGTKICLRAMTDSFTPALLPNPTPPPPPHSDLLHNVQQKPLPVDALYIPPRRPLDGEPTFKTQGRVIFTSYPEGVLEMAYKAIPIDDDGYPMIMDNENFLDALEAYIKLRIFTIKYDLGKITVGILQNTQQEYAKAAAALQDELIVPNPSEFQTIVNMWSTLIQNTTSFYRGFKDAGDIEVLRRH